MVAWGAEFCVACRIPPSAETGFGANSTVAGALLGESRVAFSAQFYGKADLYFHRAVEPVRRTAFEDSFFQELHEEVSPQGHAHLGGESIREIMPWLWLAIRSDPQNVESYLVAAFWLSGELDRPDLAHEILNKARYSNPGSYHVRIARGRLHVEQGEMHDAARAFDAALVLWPGEEDPEGVDARLGKRNILLHNALLHEMSGENDDAIKALRGILAMYPDRKAIRERAAALAKGIRPSVLADEMLHAMISKNRKTQATCDRDKHGDAHESE